MYKYDSTISLSLNVVNLWVDGKPGTEWNGI